MAAPTHGSGQRAHLASPPSTVSHFDDGSFETPKPKPNTFDEYTAGQSFGPWKVTSGSVDLMGAGVRQAAEEDQPLDLNGHDAGVGYLATVFATG